ncbi:hypothetical protein D3C72_2368480 [compost metagenome]
MVVRLYLCVRFGAESREVGCVSHSSRGGKRVRTFLDPFRDLFSVGGDFFAANEAYYVAIEF